MPNMILGGFCKEGYFYCWVNKNIKIFINYFLGPILFAWLLFSLYRQVLQQPHLEQSWAHIKNSVGSYKIISLAAVVAFMLVNWAIEAVKWQLSVRSVQPIRFIHAFKAILSGVSFSVTLPNRVGEYAGRLMYLPEGQRLKSVSLTVVGSISQLIVTFICGLSGFYLLRESMVAEGLISGIVFRFVVSGLTIACLLLTIFYFCIGRLSNWFDKRWNESKFAYLFNSLKTFNVQLLLRLLLLSFLRYLVFIVQYYLLFGLFGVHASPATVWAVISVMFLVMAVIPTVALVEVGLRGKISLHLMGIFTANSLGVLLTAVSIWLINLVVPALAGSILILGIKVFKRKHENPV